MGKTAQGSHFYILRICVCAMLIAIGVLLSGPLSIPDFSLGTYSMKVGLGSLAAILAGVLYGPLYGGIVGGLVDFLQAMIFPKGAFVPWFTLVAILSGVIPGLFFITKRRTVPAWLLLIRIFVATLVGQAVCSVGLNTYLLYKLYSIPWQALIVKRLVNQAVMVPVYSLIIWGIMGILKSSKVLYKCTDYDLGMRDKTDRQSMAEEKK